MASRLRILHVVNSLDPGGMENGIVNLTSMLEKRGIDTWVACLDRIGSFAQRLPDPSRALRLSKPAGFSPRAVKRLFVVWRRIQPMVMHSHNLDPLIYAALATAFGRTVPLLHGEHCQLTAEDLQPRRLRQRRWFYRACAGVHAVSRGIGEQLASLGFKTDQMVLTPNGVDTARFAPGEQDEESLTRARFRFKLPTHALVVGIIGRFGPFKRHLPLIEAVESLAPAWPELHLLIAGSGGSEESAVAARVRESPCADRLHWVGPQNAPEHCYRAINLLAIPSVNEGFSNVALEAMSTGVPVLANTGCGHEEIFTSGREGIITDLHSTEAIRERLLEWLHSPWEWAKMGAHGREKAVREFSLETMADVYETLYRETAARAK
jgi:glycosyltransferase involved in cell wall biosynthesis